MAKTEKVRAIHRPKTAIQPNGTAIEPEVGAPIEPPPAEEAPETKPLTTAPSKQAFKRTAPTQATFWEKVKAIPAADWGTRVFIYVYCLEPICDLRTSGEKKYLVRLDEPVYDEQKIMIDYGSGKYRLILANRKPAADLNDRIDQFEFEIFNPKYPPKIPRTVWLEDSRNRKWAALIPPDPPPFTPPPPAPPFDPMKALDTLSQIQDRVADRFEQRQPAAPTAPTVDPLTQALAIAEKFMAMKADNPLASILQQQVADAQKQNADLMLRLIEANKAAAQPHESNGMGNLRDTIKALKDELLPTVKELLPAVTEGVGRSRMGSWQEFFIAMAPTVKDLVTPIFNRMAMGGMGDTAAPQLNPGTPPGAAQPPNQAQARPAELEFLKAYAPAMLSYLADGETGGEFADYIFTGCGREWNGVEWLILKQTYGAANLAELFKRSPYAARIEAVTGEPTDTPAAKFAAFRLFLEQFVAWQPEPEGAADDGVIDLSQAKEATA